MFLQTGKAHRLLHLLFLQIFWKKADSQAFVEDRACGTLFSGNEFQGNEFHLRDFDQSINLKKDLRVNIDGWLATGSIRVEDNCHMHICNETYMQGSCESLPAGEHATSQIIQSAKCTCARDCKCADVNIPKNLKICGRAYIGDGCNACDSQYLKLLCPGWFSDEFPPSYSDSVKSIVLREGCALEIFSEESYNGTRFEVKERVLENFSGDLASYKITCDDEQYVSPQRSSYPPLIEDDEIINASLVTHPGIKAALESFESGRSYKNAYIVLVGSDWPASVGLDICNGSSLKHIRECRLRVRCDELGLANPHLGVITVNVQEDVDDNARFAATLDEYLSTHEDLKNAIPNAVVLRHWPMNDETIGNKTSGFQRKLAFVNAFRGRLLDEESSNLIVVLEGLHSTPKPIREKPDEMLSKYENVMKAWKFPSPTTIIPFRYDYSRYLPYVNGYMKMENEEYLPKNLEEQLILIAKRGGDPLGQAIFKAAYPEEKEMSKVMDTEERILSASNSEVVGYRDLLSNDSIYVANGSDFTHHETLFRQKLLVSRNILVLLKMLKTQKEKSESRISQLEIKVDAQSKLLDELKVERGRDIVGKQKEIHELMQEFQNLRTELLQSKKTGKTFHIVGINSSFVIN